MRASGRGLGGGEGVGPVIRRALLADELAVPRDQSLVDRGPLRRGRWNRFPLASISIGGVTNETRRLDHYGRVVELASEMKAFVKARRSGPASAFAFDRRDDLERRVPSRREGAGPCP